jgi:hypothetical protein
MPYGEDCRGAEHLFGVYQIVPSASRAAALSRIRDGACTPNVTIPRQKRSKLNKSKAMSSFERWQNRCFDPAADVAAAASSHFVRTQERVMTRQKLAVAVAAAFALSLTPVLADQRSRPSGGESSGSAQPRDSGGGSSSSSGTASSGSSDSGSRGGATYEAPRPARSEGSDQRRGGSATGRAVPRGSSGAAGTTRGSGGSATAGSNDASGNRDAASAARPRDGRNPTGTAVERRGPRPGGGGGVYYPGVIYDPYYYSYGYSDPYYSRRYSSYWSPFGYGYGLGYFAYDPYMFGGSPYGYDPYGGGGYGSGSYGSGGYGRQYGGEVGSIRLKVKPNDAQVYIDGYYVGVVDSYDGMFQKLGIEAGTHRVEIRADGFEPAQFEVMVMPDETITYKGELKRIR